MQEKSKNSSVVWISFAMLLLFLLVFLRLNNSARSSQNVQSENIFDLPLEDMAGEGFDLIPGQGKVLVVRFWSTDCKVCLNDLPVFNAVIRENESAAIEFLLVNLNTDREEVRKFLEDRDVDQPVYFAESNVAMSKYRLFGLPGTVIFDPDGFPTRTYYGSVNQDMLQIAIEEIQRNN